MVQMQTKAEDREFFNTKILEEIEKYLKKHKDLRFIQALWALGIIDRDTNMSINDRFYEESYTTLDTLARKLQEEKGAANYGK